MTLKEKLKKIESSTSSAEKKFFRIFQEEQVREVVPQVSVIVLAMTRAQAQELWQGGPNIQPSSSRFPAMRQALTQAFPDEQAWLTHYGGTPEAWKPHIFQGDNDGAIQGVLEDYAITLCNTPKKDVWLWLDVKASESTIWDLARQQQLDFWNALDSHYLVVIDGVSLFHPTVWRRLHDVRRVGKQVAVLLLSSVKPEPCALDKCIEKELTDDMAFTWMFDSFALLYDILYEIGVNHKRHMDRWLRAGLPELLRSRPSGSLPYPHAGAGSALFQGTFHR